MHCEEPEGRKRGTMEIDVSLAFELGPARTALLALEAARTKGQDVTEEALEIEDASLVRCAGEGGIGQRVWALFPGSQMQLRYRARVAVSRAPTRLEALAATPLHELRHEQLSFLRPSRFCQSEFFEGFVTKTFGDLAGGDRVAAMLDWIGREMRYVPGHSGSATTLLETFASRKGVCRDYVHLFCGLARASHIPARYVSAYGLRVDPPDFHAVAEVWLGERWHLVDPSGMCGADELAVIGVGRDAVDVPFMETPDDARLVNMAVSVTAG